MESQIQTENLVSQAGADAPLAGPSLRDRFHRHMHGLYLFAIVLGLMAAVAGAYAGYLCAAPLYRSTGVLRITPLSTIRASRQWSRKRSFAIWRWPISRAAS
jgi:hypothetical protein